MKLALIAVLSAAVIGVGTQAVPQAIDNASSTDESLTTPTLTKPDTKREDRAREREAEEVRGPCDEAEHANDPRCTGVQAPEDAVRDDDAAEDVSGPCDEAEHANDPRCTGAAPAPQREDEPAEDRVDTSGPGSLTSGPGPGPNAPPEREDDSGPGSSHSGSGHGDGGGEDD